MTRLLRWSLALSLNLWLALTAHADTHQNQVFQLSTDNTQLVYTVGNDGRLIFRYYGPRLSNTDQFAPWRSYNRPDCQREANYEAYPSFGLGYVNEPALSVINANGSLITELTFEGLNNKSRSVSCMVSLPCEIVSLRCVFNCMSRLISRRM